MKLQSVKVRDAVNVKGVKTAGGTMAGALYYFTAEMCSISVEGPWVVLRSKKSEFPPRYTPLANVVEVEPLEVDAGEPKTGVDSKRGGR